MANIYMNELDQYIARELRSCHIYWQRYVDDILLLSPDPERLKEAEKKITAMLSDRLKLVINPRKTLLQPLCRGIDHLGYYHLRLKTRVRRRVVAAARQKIDWAARGQAESEGIAASVNSYLGHFSQADSFVLRRSVCRRLLTGDVAMGALSVNGDFTAVRARRPRVKNGISVGQLLLDESGWAMSD